MVVSAPLCQGALPFPAAAAAARVSSARSRRGRLGLAAASRSGPPHAVTNAAPVAGAAPVGRRRCECFDLHQQIVSFAESWAMQKAIVTRRKKLVSIEEDEDEDHLDTLIALQHPPVYTLGTGSREEHLLFDVEDDPFEIHRIDRAGKVTYHGPGTACCVPDSKFAVSEIDSKGYLRSLEKVIIRALQSAFSVKASTIDGLTGVWVGDQKVAAIGIHVSRRITYHGLALNVTTDLTPFERIIPCGIKDRGVGSIKEILQNTSKGTKLNDAELMDIAYKSLIKEFSEVFQLSIELSPDLIFRKTTISSNSGMFY